METLIIAVIAGIGFILAYHTYGKWLGKTIFRLSATAVCPSTELRDDIDFVPTPRSIIFGHHFTSIAGTTLDTACRLHRYVVQEIARTPNLPLKSLQNKHVATFVAVLLAGFLALIPASGEWSIQSMGTGGLILWPMFGAINQLLAGLAFIVIAAYLWHSRKPMWFIILPTIFMLIMPLWAMVMQAFFGTNAAKSWLAEERWLLLVMAIATILLELWIIYEALALRKKTPVQMDEGL